MAGESARDVATRRREKARRLEKVADAYERGADGEERTAAALAQLPGGKWFVLHDVRWPGKRFANIDHVVVGPGGVFVIDSKAWSGRVEVRDDVLRQNGHQRQSVVANAAEAAMAVAEQVPGLPPYLAKPVLCFVGDHEIEGWARDVMLCTPQNLVAMLLSRPPVMPAAMVQRTRSQLQRSLAAATAAPTRASTGPRPRLYSATSVSRGLGALRRLLAGVVLILAGLTGLFVLLGHAGDIAKGLTRQVPFSRATEPQGHPVGGLGTGVTLPPGTNRPPLKVMAIKAGDVHRIGTLPYLFDGNRFFGVRLTIVNHGKRRWVSQPGTTYEVSGESFSPREGGSAIRIREGRVLPDPIRLAPGHRMTGYVIFQVPGDDPVTAVSVTVGPGKPATVTWRIDRQ